MLRWWNSIFDRLTSQKPSPGFLPRSGLILSITDRRDRQKQVSPCLGQDVFMAPTASVIGDVRIGRRSSFWFNTVIRGDVCSIEIGKDCNIQDGTVIHGSGVRNSLKGNISDLPERGVKIANRVSVGHSCVLHGCEIGDTQLFF